MTSCDKEPPPALFLDLLESDSVLDLLQPPSNVVDMYNFSEDIPFFNAPNILEPIDLPTAMVNPREVTRQDALIGSYFQNSLSSNDTDVTYVSQYTASSTISETSIDDVFLAPLPVPTTTAKSMHVRPVRPESPRVQPFQRPNPRATNQFVINPFIPSSKPVMWNPNAIRKTSKSRKKSARTAKRELLLKSMLTQSNPPKSVPDKTLSSSSGTRTQSLSINRTETVTTSSPGNSVGSSTVTHTLTRTVDVVTKSLLSFTCETKTKMTIAHTIDQRAASDSLCSTRAQNESINTPISTVHSRFQTTSTVTSQTASESQIEVTMAPSLSSFPVPLYPSPVIVARPPSPPDDFTAARRRSSKAPISSVMDADIKPTTAITTRPLTNLINPVDTCSSSVGLDTVTSSTLTSSSASKPQISIMLRAIQNTPSITSAHSSSSTTPRTTYAVVPTSSTCAIPPGATLYAATTTPSTKASRSGAVTVTTAGRTFTIDSPMGSYRTLTISPDFAKPITHSPVVTTQSAVPPRTNTSASASDSTVRPRSQLLIPIASTATGISYLMTSTISSLPEVTQMATFAAAIGPHVRSDATNISRTRLILQGAHNVSNTVAGLGSTIDSNRARNTLAIISPHISSQRDALHASINTIRAFAIAKPQNASASALISPNTEGVPSSRSTSAIMSNPSGASRSDIISSVTASETATKPALSRIIIQGAPNSLNSATPGLVTSNITNLGLTPSTFILTSGMATLSANATTAATRPSQRVIIPYIHSEVTTVAMTTTTTSAPFTCASPMIDTSRPRKRLLVDTISATIDSDGVSKTNVGSHSITAYTITRGRASLSAISAPSGLSRSSESFNPLTSSTMQNMFPSNAAYISFATTTVPSTAVATSCNSLASSAPSGTVAPTITPTRHRYVIRFPTPQSTTGNFGTVTGATPTPITTATLSPPERRFLETSSASQLRTFPGPRTYSVAQRNVARERERAATPRPSITQGLLSAPGPLQIFADVVCPQMTSNQATTTTTQSRVSLSQSPGPSTLVVPQYKNTVFKNLSTIGHTMTSCVRAPSPQAPTERVYLRRSVTTVSPRRTFPMTSSTYPQLQPARITYVEADSHRTITTPSEPDAKRTFFQK